MKTPTVINTKATVVYNSQQPKPKAKRLAPRSFATATKVTVPPFAKKNNPGFHQQSRASINHAGNSNNSWRTAPSQPASTQAYAYHATNHSNNPTGSNNQKHHNRQWKQASQWKHGGRQGVRSVSAANGHGEYAHNKPCRWGKKGSQQSSQQHPAHKHKQQHKQQHKQKHKAALSHQNQKQQHHNIRTPDKKKNQHQHPTAPQVISPKLTKRQKAIKLSGWLEGVTPFELGDYIRKHHMPNFNQKMTIVFESNWVAMIYLPNFYFVKQCWKSMTNGGRNQHGVCQPRLRDGFDVYCSIPDGNTGRCNDNISGGNGSGAGSHGNSGTGNMTNSDGSENNDKNNGSTNERAPNVQLFRAAPTTQAAHEDKSVSTHEQPEEQLTTRECSQPRNVSINSGTTGPLLDASDDDMSISSGSSATEEAHRSLQGGRDPNEDQHVASSAPAALPSITTSENGATDSQFLSDAITTSSSHAVAQSADSDTVSSTVLPMTIISKETPKADDQNQAGTPTLEPIASDENAVGQQVQATSRAPEVVQSATFDSGSGINNDGQSDSPAPAVIVSAQVSPVQSSHQRAATDDETHAQQQQQQQPVASSAQVIPDPVPTKRKPPSVEHPSSASSKRQRTTRQAETATNDLVQPVAVVSHERSVDGGNVPLVTVATPNSAATAAKQESQAATESDKKHKEQIAALEQNVAALVQAMRVQGTTFQKQLDDAKQRHEKEIVKTIKDLKQHFRGVMQEQKDKQGQLLREQKERLDLKHALALRQEQDAHEAATEALKTENKQHVLQIQTTLIRARTKFQADLKAVQQEKSDLQNELSEAQTMLEFQGGYADASM